MTRLDDVKAAATAYRNAETARSVALAALYDVMSEGQGFRTVRYGGSKGTLWSNCWSESGRGRELIRERLLREGAAPLIEVVIEGETL